MEKEMMLARARDKAIKAIAETEKACAEFIEIAQPETDDTMLRECLAVLEYATYHDGRYGQVHVYERFQQPAQKLVSRLAERLGVKAYDWAD